MVDITLPDYITPLTHAIVTRGHNSRLNTPFSKINAYKHSFFPESANQWNRLPAHVINTPNLVHFVIC